MKTNDSLYKTKNYINRKLKEPIYIILTVIWAFIYPPALIISATIFLLLKTQTITIFEVNNDFFNIYYPYQFLNKKKKEYKLNEIEEIRIKKRGNGGYGNMPYLDLHFKNGTRKRQTFDTLDKEDFEGFTQAIKSKLGEDKLFVNES